MKLKEITNPTYPKYNIGGCIAKAGSCKTGFMSAPSIAPNGSILSNGFDVNSKNNVEGNVEPSTLPSTLPATLCGNEY